MQTDYFICIQIIRKTTISNPDPDSIGSKDPDSEFRKAKCDPQKIFDNFMFFKSWTFFLEVWRHLSGLISLSGGLRRNSISKFSFSFSTEVSRNCAETLNRYLGYFRRQELFDQKPNKENMTR